MEWKTPEVYMAIVHSLIWDHLLPPITAMVPFLLCHWAWLSILQPQWKSMASSALVHGRI